jgi:Cys-tRNA(Pro)/Cys-tRNA(Cys) deacylase
MPRRSRNRTPENILRDAGIEFRVHEHVPVATHAEILVALPFPAEEHVKTLAFEADGRVALAVLRGSDRLRFGPFARAVGVGRDRLAPLSADQVRSELGLEPGGVCPVVDRDDVVVVADVRVPALARAFCGSGRSDATLELAGADLVAASGAVVTEIAA